MERVDYDKIAHHYDERYRDHGVDAHLLAFLDGRRNVAPATQRILDVGCGTGKQLAANRQHLPGVTMVGVDRFEGMLRIARQRCPEVAWIQGDGAALPLSSQTFDYATSQFSYPHVRNPSRLLEEVFRTLRTGGRFVMTNIDPWSMTGWAVYRYFPEALTLDHQDFLPVERFVELMRDTGFQDVCTRRESRRSWKNVHEFLAFASERHRASQLMAITDHAYAAGLRRVEDAVRASSGQDAAFASEFVVVTIAGDKAQALTPAKNWFDLEAPSPPRATEARSHGAGSGLA